MWFAFFVGLELFDGKGAFLVLASDGFVNSAIGAAADEADDFVPGVYLFLAGIAGASRGHGTFIGRIY